MKNNEPHTFPPIFYQKMLRNFIEEGEIPDETTYVGDDLAEYLVSTMNDNNVRASVLQSKLCARVYYDTMIQLVSLCVEKARYRLQRVAAEQRQINEAHDWTLIRRANGWRALVQMASERCKEQGLENRMFERKFGEERKYADDIEWNYFLKEWQDALNARLKEQTRIHVSEQSAINSCLLRGNLKAIPKYVKEHHVSNDEFFQTWALMGGRWNAMDYERHARIAKLQYKYPVLIDIVNRMGRIADPSGRRKIGISSGQGEQLPRASQSDISGVSLGRELNALLPFEMAQFLDNQLEDVFLQKYVTSRLQIFDSKSHSAAASRSLYTKPARPKGPFLVCCDTSGSMLGEPFQIALSLMMRLSELAMLQQRDCFLIAFATDARPVDVLHERSLLLRFFRQEPKGRTDARMMLNLLDTTIRSMPRYAGADVLWITDFRIPMVSKQQLVLFEQLHSEGTRFYGLQIGIAENHWIPYFDEIYQIKDVKMPIT